MYENKLGWILYLFTSLLTENWSQFVSKNKVWTVLNNCWLFMRQHFKVSWWAFLSPLEQKVSLIFVRIVFSKCITSLEAFSLYLHQRKNKSKIVSKATDVCIRHFSKKAKNEAENRLTRFHGTFANHFIATLNVLFVSYKDLKLMIS